MKEIKKVSLEDMKEFFKQGFNYLEYYGNTNNEQWEITFSLKDYEKITEYWAKKGYKNFTNLTLIFK